jgi:hypothetical protein
MYAIVRLIWSDLRR